MKDIPRVKMNMTKEFNFYSVTDFTKHAGEWVAIVDNEVVASGKDLKEVHRKAMQRSGGREPLFARVPIEQETLIL